MGKMGNFSSCLTILVFLSCNNGGGGDSYPKDVEDPEDACPEGQFLVEVYDLEPDRYCLDIPEGVSLPIETQEEAEAIAVAANEATGFDCSWNNVTENEDSWSFIETFSPTADAVYFHCDVIVMKETAATYCRLLG
jgi:hypothetical protein